MRVEQYVYYFLGCPELKISGDVVSPLNTTENPIWINRQSNCENEKSSLLVPSSKKILFKGPCDMSQMYAFLDLGESAVTEFSYVNDSGVYVEGHNHTSQIVTSLTATAEEKDNMVSEMMFFDAGMFDTSLGKASYDFVVLSMLTDGNLGVYRRKSTGYEISLCEKYYDITHKENRLYYLNGDIFTSRINFTEHMLDEFAEKFSFVDNADAHKTIDNLDKIRNYLDEKTVLVLLLGSEREFKKKCEKSYVDRHLQHAVMNRAITEWSKEKNNVVLIPFDKYIKGDNDFLDTINHFVKRVYYDLACDLAKLFCIDGNNVKVKSKALLIKLTMRQNLKNFKAKIQKFFKE